MLHTFLIAAAALVCVVAAVVLLAARRPDQFRTERSVLIAAPAERIFPLIADPRAFNTWNPFNEDPSIKGNYTGPERGPGARYTFESRRSGTGYSEIVEETAPRHVGVQLVMTKPMACNNRVDFALAPEGQATRVTWTMAGTSPLMAKVMGMVIDCEKMCGDQFSKGLGKLKSLAEASPARSSEAA